MKCYEITPSPNPAFDSMIVAAGETWQPALNMAEDALEGQFLRLEEEGKSWDDISVTIKCVEKTQEELDELES